MRQAAGGVYSPLLHQAITVVSNAQHRGDVNSSILISEG